MSAFLVETYLSRPLAAVATPRAEDVARTADELSREGKPVQLVQTVFVPQDEICFYLFEAQSSDVVAEAARRAGLVFERLLEARSDWSPPAATDRGT